MSRGAAARGAALGRLVSRAETLAGTRRGAGVLFAVALGVYLLQSIALPLIPGRDLGTYLGFYVQMLDWDAVRPMTMLFRTPVAPLVAGGSLDLLGGWGAQVVMAALYAGSIVAWSAVALAFGRRAALVTAVALLVYPGYGILFHELSSDAVCAAAFAGWASLLTRAVLAPLAGRFALVGLGLAVLALTRPGNQILLVFVAAPLALRLPWRRRAVCAAAAAAAALVPLGAWAVNNGLRYEDTTVARGGAAYFPLFRALVEDRIVRPENGPASRELARAVERRLLVEEPYRSYGVDLDTFLARGRDRVFEDLLGLSDRVWGWDSDYAKLREVGREAVAEHPWDYVRGVAGTVWEELWKPLYVALPAARSERSDDGVVTVGGRQLPRPTDGDVVPAAHQGFYSTTPDGSIREVWTSATEHTIAFSSAERQRRFEELGRREDDLIAELPPYDGSVTLTRSLSRSSRVYPRPALWLGVGLVALLVRRPRRAGLAAALAGAGLLAIVFTALGIYAVIEFAVPFVPAFVVFAAAGLVGAASTRKAEIRRSGFPPRGSAYGGKPLKRPLRGRGHGAS